MSKKKVQIRNTTTDFLIFTMQSQEDGIDVKVDKDTVWLSQKSMAKLFNCTSDNIGLHLKNIFESKELEEKSVTEKYSATASDGKTYKIKFYNLDAIISVGYRINSISLVEVAGFLAGPVLYLRQKLCPNRGVCFNRVVGRK